MKKKTKRKLCRKCGNGYACHYCGRAFDTRGYDRCFGLRKNGPTHYICPSCAE